MTKRLLATLALVAWLSTGCFTVLGAMGDSTAPRSTQAKPSTTGEHSGLLAGMVIDAGLFALAVVAVNSIDIDWGCNDSCSD